MGKKAIAKYRENPEVFAVGYELDKKFWDALLKVEEEEHEVLEALANDEPKLSISDRFRSSKRRGLDLSDPSTTMTGQEKINYLISSIEDIQDRLVDGTIRSVGAVGYAAIGGVIEDGVLNESYITTEELNNYLEAKDLVLNHDYAVAQTAEQMFMQEHAANE